MKKDSRTFIVTFFVSSICHLVFFAVLIFLPAQVPAKKFSASVINVSMVSGPWPQIEPGPAGKSNPAVKQQEAVPRTPDKPPVFQEDPPAPKVAEPAESAPREEEKEQKPEQKQVKEPEDEKAVSVAAEKVKLKKSLKKSTFKSAQVVKRAIERIEKKTEASRPKQVEDALTRLRDKVGKGGAAMDRLRESTSHNTQGQGGGIPGGREQGGGIPGGRGQGGGQNFDLLGIYKLEISNHIESRWAFPEQIAGGQTGLETVLIIKIMPNGEIKNIWFEKRSGNNYFDDSAYKAIVKSNPLPPLPKGFLMSEYNVGLIFTPSGLNRGGRLN
ncbi:MAG: cell envelope integrity protein TolA [Desulfobacterales bacterium]|nr:cell envelope integrity protein TolA [Desulfobacterales bacterium]